MELTGTPKNQPSYALFWRGTTLYAAGNFYSTSASVAKWDGATWSKVGSWGLGALWWHYATNSDYPLVLDAMDALYVDGNNNVWAGGILGQADGWPTGHLAYSITSSSLTELAIARESLQGSNLGTCRF